MTSTPQFVRKQDVADRLLLTVRSVNRLIEEGALHGVKISAGRSAVTSESLNAYVARRTGKPEPEVGPYHSDALAIIIAFDGEIPPGGARAIDLHLSRRYGGVSVWQITATELTLSWPWSLPYTRDQIWKYLAKLDTPAIAINVGRLEAENAGKVKA